VLSEGGERAYEPSRGNKSPSGEIMRNNREAKAEIQAAAAALPKHAFDPQPTKIVLKELPLEDGTCKATEEGHRLVSVRKRKMNTNNGREGYKGADGSHNSSSKDLPIIIDEKMIPIKRTRRNTTSSPYLKNSAATTTLNDALRELDQYGFTILPSTTISQRWIRNALNDPF